MTWRPARRRTPVLHQIDLHIPAGQRVLLAGPSGAGKSTLLRAIAGLLLSAGDGDLDGRVRIDGQVGLLLQDPTAAIVAETVGRDVAFGLENQRVPRAQMWQRVRDALDAAAFPYPEQHATAALSGGESQRLALAGSLVLDSSVMLLDEPTSMLDPESAASVRAAVRYDADRRGATTIIVEHHIEPWLDFVDRLIVIGRGGRIIADGVPTDVLAREGPGLAAAGVWVPGYAAPTLTTVDPELVAPWAEVPDVLVTATQVSVWLKAGIAGLQRTKVRALDSVDAQLRGGRTLAVTGASGAGKSTLVSVLAGLTRPTAGQVHSADTVATSRGDQPWRWSARDLTSRLAWVPQIPEHGVVAKTVADEVVASARSCRRDPDWTRSRADGLLETLGLSHLSGASPYHLSGGEQRRLMVAAALAHGPLGVLLDEPTVGQDRLTWAAVLGTAAAARDAGAALAVSSHDQEAVGAIADDHLELSAGTAR